MQLSNKNMKYMFIIYLFVDILKKNYDDETLKSVLPLLLNNIRSMISKAREGESASHQYITTLSVIEAEDTKGADIKGDGDRRQDDTNYSLSPASSSHTLHLPPPQESDKERMSSEQIQELMRMETVVSGPIRKAHFKDIHKIRNIFDQADDADTPGKQRGAAAGCTNPNLTGNPLPSIEDNSLR